MEGGCKEGWYEHQSMGVIKIFQNQNGSWVYQCYTSNGAKPLSRERPLDSWTWALSQKVPEPE